MEDCTERLSKKELCNMLLPIFFALFHSKVWPGLCEKRLSLWSKGCQKLSQTILNSPRTCLQCHVYQNQGEPVKGLLYLHFIPPNL